MNISPVPYFSIIHAHYYRLHTKLVSSNNSGLRPLLLIAWLIAGLARGMQQTNHTNKVASKQVDQLVDNIKVIKDSKLDRQNEDTNGKRNTHTKDGKQNEEANLTSNFETFWNICNTIQGLPILTIPYAVHNGGYLAVFSLLVVAIASNYTGKTIVKCLYEDTEGGKRERVRSSYVDVGHVVCPRYGGYLVLVTQFIELLFIATVYPLMVGRLLTKSFPNCTLPYWAWTLIGGIAFLPNILLKNLKQVAWTSIITVLAAKVIFVAVFAYSLAHYSDWGFASLEKLNLQTFPAALGILVASYLSQPFVPVIEGGMRHKEKFNFLMNISYLMMTLLNVLIGVVASITFQSHTAEVITNNLPQGSFRRAVNLMAAVLAFTSYTLPMFTIFEIVEKSSLPCLPSFSETVRSRPYVGLILRLFMISLSVVQAAFIPYYSYFLAFVGSIAGICLEFIFPSLFHLKIYFHRLSWWEMFLDVCLVAIGASVSVTGAIVSGRSLIEAGKRTT